MTCTRADLIHELTSQLGLSKNEAKTFVEGFFEILIQSLEKGETVKLSRMGNFVVRKKSIRPGRNPKTKAFVPILPRKVVTFRSSQTLKSLISARQAARLGVEALAPAATCLETANASSEKELVYS